MCSDQSRKKSSISVNSLQPCPLQVFCCSYGSSSGKWTTFKIAGTNNLTKARNPETLDKINTSQKKKHLRTNYGFAFHKLIRFPKFCKVIIVGFENIFDR